MRIITNIYLRYGLTRVKINLALFTNSVVLSYSKDVHLDWACYTERISKNYSLVFFTREYKEHWEWVKSAWFDDTVKPPYITLSDYDPIPF